MLAFILALLGGAGVAGIGGGGGSRAAASAAVAAPVEDTPPVDSGPVDTGPVNDSPMDDGPAPVMVVDKSDDSPATTPKADPAPKTDPKPKEDMVHDHDAQDDPAPKEEEPVMAQDQEDQGNANHDHGASDEPDMAQDDMAQDQSNQDHANHNHGNQDQGSQDQGNQDHANHDHGTPDEPAPEEPAPQDPAPEEPDMAQDQNNQDHANHDHGNQDQGNQDQSSQDHANHDHGTPDEPAPEEPAPQDPAPEEPDMAQDQGNQDHANHDHGNQDQGNQDHANHDNHGDNHGDPVTLPTTPAEIDAFVAAVRAAQELHVHDHGSDKLGEHEAVMDLVSPAEATHIAIGHGSWFDPANWHNGEIPGDDAKVVIPNGVRMEYDGESNASLFTLRVDGALEFATDTDSKMVIDTFIVAPGGALTIGTETNPVEDDVTVDIVIANNGAIDTNWDPGLFSRGLISHGETTIHGQIKDAHDKVVDDPMAGDTSLTFDGIPTGWEVGDKIVIAGTHYDGYKYDNSAGKKIYHEPEDEVRIITEISGNKVYFDDPLVHDHDTPRDDLYTSVANYSRNVTVRSEDGAESELYERGHVMMMHSDDVDVRYAAFDELGRTDKSKLSQEPGDYDQIAFDSNVSGRYSLHLHRLGTENLEDPAIVSGNAVFGSPGWGFVHHDSNAHLENNASYDTFGAGFVSETGNETGKWIDNIAIDAQGRSWSDPKVQSKNGLDEFDTGVSGDGFWFQSRLVESEDNVAASVAHGFVYFHRGPKDGDIGDRQIQFHSEDFAFPEALNYGRNFMPDDAPILNFTNNEAFAAKDGLHVVKANPNQGHDIHSVFDGFTAWNVVTGAHFEYTSHYVIKDFDLVGKGEVKFSEAQDGIEFGKNVTDMVIVDAKIAGFEIGMDLQKSLVGFNRGPDVHDFVIIDSQISDVDAVFENYDPLHDQVITSSDLPEQGEIGVSFNEPLTYSHAGVELRLKGIKTDGVGETTFPAGTDKIILNRADMRELLKVNGYYEDEDGTNYLVFNLYFSDRLTGDIYKQKELIELNDDVRVGKANDYYHAATFNGTKTLAELQAMTDMPAAKVEVSEDGGSSHAGHMDMPQDGDPHGMANNLEVFREDMQDEDLWGALTGGHGNYDEHMPADDHHNPMDDNPDLILL